MSLIVFLSGIPTKSCLAWIQTLVTRELPPLGLIYEKARKNPGFFSKDYKVKSIITKNIIVLIHSKLIDSTPTLTPLFFI